MLPTPANAIASATRNSTKAVARPPAALEPFASMWAWPRKVGTHSLGTRELVCACIPHASNTAADRSSFFAQTGALTYARLPDARL